jgi:hypothetical protein
MSLLRGSALLALSWAALACTTSAAAPPLLVPTSTGDAFGAQACSALRPPTEPDLMAWDAGSRANLKTLAERGVVAVRYAAEGCDVELEVLNCTGEETYAFSPYAATDTKIAKSTGDLRAELPVGAARLGGSVGGGRALRTDYMLAGVLAMPSLEAYPSAKLRGSGCERATHVVGKVYVGGFAMAAGESERISGSASLFAVGVSAEATEERGVERIASEGRAEACQKAQDQGTLEPGCSVPLRIGLVPIAGREAPATADRPSGDATAARERATIPEALADAASATANDALTVGSDVRFRGGIAAGPTVIVVPDVLGGGGLRARLGIQINDALGLHADPSVVAFANNGELGMLAGLAFMGDVTVGDVLTAGAGPSLQAVADGNGNFGIGPRVSVGVHLLGDRGADRVRRTSLFLAVEADLLFGPPEPLVAPSLLLGYEAF